MKLKIWSQTKTKSNKSYPNTLADLNVTFAILFFQRWRGASFIPCPDPFKKLWPRSSHSAFPRHDSTPPSTQGKETKQQANNKNRHLLYREDDFPSHCDSNPTKAHKTPDGRNEPHLLIHLTLTPFDHLSYRKARWMTVPSYLTTKSMPHVWVQGLLKLIDKKVSCEQDNIWFEERREATRAIP